MAARRPYRTKPNGCCERKSATPPRRGSQVCGPPDVGTSKAAPPQARAWPTVGPRRPIKPIVVAQPGVVCSQPVFWEPGYRLPPAISSRALFASLPTVLNWLSLDYASAVTDTKWKQKYRIGLTAIPIASSSSSAAALSVHDRWKSSETNSCHCHAGL